MKGHVRMSKAGPATIRAKIYMASVAAGTHNPDIKAQKERLLAAGKAKMQAVGAAMRKLMQICFGVIKHQTPHIKNEKSPAETSEAFRIMVPRPGIEPGTRGFSIPCSTD